MLLPACSARKYQTEALSKPKRTLSKIIKKIYFHINSQCKAQKKCYDIL